MAPGFKASTSGLDPPAKHDAAEAQNAVNAIAVEPGRQLFAAVRGASWLIQTHLAIGPILKIAGRERLEERVGFDQLFARGPAGCISARHE
jgi:hypothetical protein